MSINIYVITHKKYSFLPDMKPYKIMQVNAAANGHYEFANTFDDVGDNISNKNKNYCELTALYEVWKNEPRTDFIGLTHYRRYFYFPADNKFFIDKFLMSPTDNKVGEKINITESTVKDMLSVYDIILPKVQYSNGGMKAYYCNNHRKEDFLLMESVVKELYPDYAKSFDKVMNGHKFYGYNMFITSYDIFQKYMSWLFNILFTIEKRITISTDPYQARVFGFMSERLFTLFVYHNNYKIKEEPIVYLDDNVHGLTWERRSYRTMLASLGLIGWY